MKKDKTPNQCVPKMPVHNSVRIDINKLMHEWGYIPVTIKIGWTKKQTYMTSE